jgi:transposase
MPATQIAKLWFPDNTVGEMAIRSCLRRAGLRKRWAKRKPALTPDLAQRRLAFARAHEYWTPDDWLKVLWTDETWATSGLHGGEYVWCEDNEVFYDDCTVPRYQEKRKWLFWGSFVGAQKGPCFFWDRNEHGTVNQETYIRYICPLIINFHRQLLEQGIDFILMQDGAPGHRAHRTIQHLRSHNIRIIKWPANSPDLNPIENLWAIMKDWIADNYPEYTDNQDENKAIVQEAWDHIRSEHLYNLAASMPDRIQAVIEAKGYHTRY